MKKMSGILATVLISLIGLGFAQQAFLPDPRVKAVKFEGLVNASESQVRDLIMVREGDNYSDALVNSSLKRLISLDMFNDAKVDLTAETNGVVIVFQLRENLFVRNVKYEGMKSSEVSQDDLKTLVAIPDSSFFTQNKIARALSSIRRKYQETGFRDVGVSYQLQPVNINSNTYDLLIRIDEGDKIVIEKIDIKGATIIPAADLKGIMKNKEKVFILQSGVLDLAEFELDRKRLEEMYHHKGLLDVKVKRYEWVVEEMGDDKHKAIAVYIELEEGEVYTAGSFKISGNQIFTTNELSAYIDMKEGDVYDKIKIDMARASIYNRYSDAGYLFANVSYQMNRNPSNRVVDTVWVIDEGRIAHIEKVLITGNTKTHESVIRRELLFNEGEIYNQTKVRTSFERLSQLQYFKNVNPRVSPGSAEGLINLELEVEEERTGLITMGAGYGSESGFNLQASIQEKNLFGWGRVIGFKTEYGQRKQMLEASYQEPWLFGDPTFAGVSASYSRTLYENIPTDENNDGVIDSTNVAWSGPDSNLTLSSYTNGKSYFKESLGLSFNISRRFFIFWTAFVGLGFSMYRDVTNSDPNYMFSNPLIYSDGRWQVDTNLQNSLSRDWTLKNTLSSGISLNNTDNPINPTRGMQFDLNALLVGGFLGGNIHYIKPRFNLNGYWNPWWKFVFAFHASSDMILPQFNETTAKYDSSDLLWFDGVYEMRGWLNYSERGETKAFFSTELRFQIYNQELWGSLFFDLGNLWTGYRDWTVTNPLGYMFSFGAGIRINIPMLPIRMYMARRGYYDAATANWKLDGDGTFWDNWQFVFSIQGLF